VVRAKVLVSQSAALKRRMLWRIEKNILRGEIRMKVVLLAQLCFGKVALSHLRGGFTNRILMWVEYQCGACLSITVIERSLEKKTKIVYIKSSPARATPHWKSRVWSPT